MALVPVIAVVSSEVSRTAPLFDNNTHESPWLRTCREKYQAKPAIDSWSAPGAGSRATVLVGSPADMSTQTFLLAK